MVQALNEYGLAIIAGPCSMLDERSGVKYNEYSRKDKTMSNEEYNGRQPKMTLHTPGPWQLDALDALDIHEGPTLIASVSAWDVHDPDERAANARLIAAAPEMLVELKETVAELIRQGVIEHAPVIKQARDTIAKAELRPTVKRVVR